MRYEKPDMELIWLEGREVFMTISTGTGDGSDFEDDDGEGDF